MENIQLEQNENLGQVPDGGYLSQQLQPAIQGAAAEIRLALDKQRKGFWLGFGAGALMVLSMRYILQKEL